MNFRIGIYLAAATGVVCLWLFLVRFPMERQQQGVHEELAQVQKQVDEFNTTVALLPAYLKERDELQRQAALATSHLFAKRQILQLFEQIEKQSSFYDLKLLEITPPVAQLVQMNEIAANSSDPLFLDVSLRLSGSYLNFGRFVETLEQSPYFRGVNRCLVGANSTDNRTTSFLIDFRALLGGQEGTT